MRGPRSWTLWRPGPVILLAAPLCGEGLPGSTPPLDLVLPWNLALMVALYGSGALLCRELVHRRGRGLAALWVMGAAYGVYEEGLVDRYWTYPAFWRDSGVGTYSVLAHTNVLLAVFLTVFHATVSITVSVLVVERLFPERTDTAWVGAGGLGVATLVLFVAVPFVYGEFDRGPGPLGLALTAALCAGLVVLALWLVPRRPGRHRVSAGSAPRIRAPGWTAFLALVALWVIVYGVPSTGVPWPAGVGLALVPVALAGWRLRGLATTWPSGPVEVRALTGVAAFFVLLDLFLAVAGRYDMALMALLTVVVVRRLRRTTQPVGAGAVSAVRSAAPGRAG